MFTKNASFLIVIDFLFLPVFSKNSTIGMGCTLLLLLSFTSCIKEIPLKPSNEKKVLVINAIINTNEPIKVRLSHTLGITIADSGLVSDAEIKLFENDVYVNTLANVGNGMYTSTITPTLKKAYKLIATSANFPVAVSKEVIPTAVKLTSYTFKYIGKVYNDYNDDYVEAIQAALSFTDPSGEKNYYEMIFRSTGSPKYLGSYMQPSFFDNPVIANEGDVAYFPSTYVFSDELFDGTNFTLNLKMSFLGGTTNGALSPNYYTVSFRSVSYNYYKYRKMWTRHKHNQSSEIYFWEDIFNGEPIDMFTNVENGYGIFAGYSSDEQKGIFIP